MPRLPHAIGALQVPAHSARWLLVPMLLAAGCASPPRFEVSQWELEVEGGGPPAVVTLPLHLDLPPEDGTYHLRAEVDLPESLRDQDVHLVIPYLPALVELRAGGHTLPPLREDLGHPYRHSGEHTWFVPQALTATSPLALELVVAHRWRQSAWLETVPRLLPASGVDPDALLIRVTNDLGGACGSLALSQIGLTYLIVFLADRRRTAYLWFGLQGIGAAYYPFFILGYSQHLLGTWDIPLVALLLTAAPIASIYFTHAQFSLGPPSRFWLAALAAIVAAVASSPGPHAVAPYWVTVVTVFAAVTYQIVVCLRLLARSEPPAGAALVLACWVVLGATAWTDLLAWIAIVDVTHGARLACIGLALFALLQAMLLSTDHIRTLRRADALNVALQGRVQALEVGQREIQALNEELRRQIADRSEQLAEALARVGSRGQGALALAPGDIIEDRYRVVRQLGAGGMGAVHEVERLRDGRRLALKLTTGGDPMTLARLAREAQIAAQLEHPNVVGILDVDVAASGMLFIVMEYVAGTSLHEHRTRFGDVPWARGVLHQVALGLGALHARGIVHRDLKPANILLSDDDGARPSVKITDFGISRIGLDDVSPPGPTVELTPRAATSRAAADVPPAPSAPPEASDDPTGLLAARAPRISAGPSSSPLTQHGAVIGTPRYMAPEIGGGAPAGPASDVFAFGLLACELLTRRYPFDEPPVTARIEGREPSPLPDLVWLHPEVDAALLRVIVRCLDLDPAARPSPEELADAF